jgi:hypothetical protein
MKTANPAKPHNKIRRIENSPSKPEFWIQLIVLDKNRVSHHDPVKSIEAVKPFASFFLLQASG